MATIGNNDVSGSVAFSVTPADGPQMPVLDDGGALSYLYTPPTAEVATEIGVYPAATLASADTVLEIGLYDTSSGVNNANLVASDTITGPFTLGQWNVKAVNWPIIAGNRYGVTLVVNSSTSGAFYTLSRPYLVNSGRIDNTSPGATPLNYTSTNTSISLLVYASTELAQLGPTFNDPSPVQNKTGDTVNIDTAALGWMVSTGGALVYTTGSPTVLPAGLSIDAAGVITGTLPDQGASFNALIECFDDSGATQGSFTWEIEPYSIHFTMPTTLADKDGNDRTTGATIQATVYDGSIGSSLTNPQRFQNQTIDTGNMLLTPVVSSPGQPHVVLLEDTADGTGVYVPLGAFPMIAE